MKKSKLLSALLLTFGLGVVGSAHALTVEQVISTYGRFQFEDDNAETIINRNGGNPFVLDVGDSLAGIISFPQIKNQSGVGSPQTFMLGSVANGGNGNSSLSAIFEIQVTGKVQTAGAGTPLDPTDDRFTFTFGSNAAFGASVGTAGAMIAFYENDLLLTPTSCGGTIPACNAAAMAGTKILSLGFTGDLDEGWKAFNSPEFTDLSGEPPSNTFGSFNYNLGTLYSTIGQFYNDQTAFAAVSQGVGDGKVQWTGSGTIEGGQGYSPFTSSSDAQLQAHRIPEPASLSLLGLALVGLGAMRRRSRA